MKKIIVILSILGIVFILFMFIVSDYLFNFALNPKKDKSLIFTQSEKIKKNYDFFDNFEEKEEIFINNSENLKLKGYIFEHKDKKTDKWVIAVHGFSSSPRRLSEVVSNIYNMGYNILTPVLQAHEGSEGKYYTMGGKDSSDLVIWCNTIIKEKKAKKIVLYGESMGAATVMLSLSKGLPDEVVAFIEDCGYYSLEQMYKYELKNLFKLPSFPLIQFQDIYMKFKTGVGVYEIDATKGLKNTKLPAFLIHGTKDKFVPYENVNVIYDMIQSEKEILTPEADHAGSYKAIPKEYFQKIEKFLNKYL